VKHLSVGWRSQASAAQAVSDFSNLYKTFAVVALLAAPPIT